MNKIDLGICTSFYNGYGKYMDRWLRSIMDLKTMPNQISIILSGPDNGYLYGLKETEITELHIEGSKLRMVYLPQHISMGYARNKAVEYLDTEYVQYLDVDDEILPNAVEIYSRYAPTYDVISGGLKIQGDRTPKDLLFTHASTEEQLKGRHCCCSHAVYRKSFWEKSPYIESNDYVDQPLWLRFAQLGAKFIGTPETCTVYNASKTGHNLSLTPEQRAEAKEQYKRIMNGGN